MISARPSITTDLAERGYCLLRGRDLRLGPGHPAALAELAAAWDDLPADPYLAEPHRYRFRRHARYRCAGGEITRLPDGPYYQSEKDNRLFGGTDRTFAPVTPRAGENPFLLELLRFNIAQLPPAGAGWDVNIHLVRIVGSRDVVGEPVPEGVHRDGFAYVSMHLMKRENVVGGETEVRAEDGTHLLKGVLEHPLDSLYLDDRALLHYTSPISPADDEPAHRDMLLVSYDPCPASS
ncbi:2OG-Fe dioxygenase family protein [Actinoplanes sp. NPDC049548]|uniref:2OG-Fe dioxygenase family protein n=1 Tax=Actinoplanes sp. NPDC049548 TaxID=3155152 RepID=UPI00343AD4F6